MPNLLDHIRELLEQHGSPMHYAEITDALVRSGTWRTQGRTPQATVRGLLASTLRDGRHPWLMSTAPGTYGIAFGSDPPSNVNPPEQSEDPQQDEPTLSFSDAAERILREYADGSSMHFRDITRLALEKGLIRSKGQTPAATMHAQIITENARRARNGEPTRFERLGKGQIALVQRAPDGLETQIAMQNDGVRERLIERLHALEPVDFEALVGELLTAMGFEDVTVTRLSGDKGIDVRGTLVIADAVRVPMAVQAKKWRYAVQAPVVREVRGSLSPHERALIISTGEFSSGARSEAVRPDAAPVGLMNGKSLVGLLIEHEIMVRRHAFEILRLPGEEQARAGNPDSGAVSP